MNSLLKPAPHKPFIAKHNLDAVQWVNTSSPGGLNGREMDLFHLLASCLRMNPGRKILRCTVAELARAHVTAHVRPRCSPSTVRRALSGLEEKGYLRRRNCRLGSSCRGVELVFCLEKWSYWTGNRSGKVVPISAPTSVHIPLRQSLWEGEDRTSITHGVNTRNIGVNSRNKKHTGEFKKHRYHPIVFTLWCLLTKVKAPDRQNLVNRAELEIKAHSAGVEISNHTGIPWEQYERNWRDMLPPVRESFARSQIVPRLRQSPPRDVHQPTSNSAIPTDMPQESKEDIQRLIRESLSCPPQGQDMPPHVEPVPVVDCVLGSRDRAVLEHARKVARARCVNDG